MRRMELAEGVGFEPTRAFALPVFKTGAINRSTTPPGIRGREKCVILGSASKVDRALRRSMPNQCAFGATISIAPESVRGRST